MTIECFEITSQVRGDTAVTTINADHIVRILPSANHPNCVLVATVTGGPPIAILARYEDARTAWHLARETREPQQVPSPVAVTR
jgi:hypothetical protein